MFHSAAIKLTGWYLAIIMVLSIGCSLALYRVSSIDLSRNIHRQTSFFNGFLGPSDFKDYNRLRSYQLNQDINHLRQNLILFNLAVLGGGGALSYLLARRTLQPIEDMLESQTRFTADASHELRTPLAAIRAENEVALRDKSLSKEAAIKLLRSNLEEVAKLKALSDGLLRLAAENGETIEKQPLPIKTIVDEAAARHDTAAKAKKIKIIKSVKDLTVNGDHQSLVELINILIDNAVKYSPSGSEVKISSAKKEKCAFISVADSGAGISADDLPHVFDRFYRADTSRSKDASGGYGLGLAIAKKIADLHNAAIMVKSAPGKGSTFTVQLPLA